MTHAPLRGLAALVTAAGLLMLIGCGGDTDSAANDVASVNDSPSPGGDDAPASSVSDAVREAAVRDHAQCMRDQGIADYPDPNFDTTEQEIEVSSEWGTPAYEAAEAVCDPMLDAVIGTHKPPDPEFIAEMLETELAFANCMRDHGIDWPDPKMDDYGPYFEVPADLDPTSPAVEEATAACEEIRAG